MALSTKRQLIVLYSLLFAFALLFLAISILVRGVGAGGAAGMVATAGLFVDSGQSLGDDGSTGVALGDLDGDGDVDAFVINFDAPHFVYLNQGGVQGGTPGEFLKNGQDLGAGEGLDISLGDLDNDGDLDAVVILSTDEESNQVWINQGGLQGGAAGFFMASTQKFGDNLSSAGALGLLDGDSNLDLFVTRGFGQIHKLWLGGGNALFTDTLQPLSTGSGTELALGDVDGDDDLDAFIAMGADNALWINQGGAQAGAVGVFLDSGQALTSTLSLAVALGDLDGDDDLDAFVANSLADKVWINQGGSQGGAAGIFKDGGQALSSDQSRDVALGDVDSDGDLDAFLGKSGANEVWINQGGAQAGVTGVFTASGQSLGGLWSEGVALADLDWDGDLDAFVANRNGPNKVWLNQSSVAQNLGQFIDSGQRLGGSWTFNAELADLEGDGDLDLVMVYSEQLSVWKNDGAAIFSEHFSYTIPLLSQGVSIDVGDIDNDPDRRPDIVIAGITETLINDGSGLFQANGALPDDGAHDLILGDLDGDDDLDLLVRYELTYTYEFRIWVNAGGFQGGTPGQFEDRGGRMGRATFKSQMALGDLDGDGDLDAILSYTGIAGDNHSARVWLNQGGLQAGTEGDFTFSGHSFDGPGIAGISLGDVDGDGDLDVHLAKKIGVGSEPEPDKLWLNSGGHQGGTAGIFVDSNEGFDFEASFGSTLGDVDGDGDVDLLVSALRNVSVWLNDGRRQGGLEGEFTDSGQRLNANNINNVNLGDLDDDGDQDAVIYGVSPTTFWLNGEELITPTVSLAHNLLDSGQGGPTLHWWLLSNAIVPIQVTRNMNSTVQLLVFINDVADTLTFPPGTLTQYPTYRPDQPGGALGELLNPFFGTDPRVEGVLDVNLESVPGTVEVFGIDSFIIKFNHPEEIVRYCFLEGVQFMGDLAFTKPNTALEAARIAVEPQIEFDLFYQLRDEIMAASPQGRYYRALYTAFSPELLQITAQNVGLLKEIIGVIQVWSPAFRALVDGQGSTATITPGMIGRAIELLEAYEFEAGLELAATIRREMNLLDLESFSGLTMDEALVKVNERPLSELFLPIITTR